MKISTEWTNEERFLLIKIKAKFIRDKYKNREESLFEQEIIEYSEDIMYLSTCTKSNLEANRIRLLKNL